MFNKVKKFGCAASIIIFACLMGCSGQQQSVSGEKHITQEIKEVTDMRGKKISIPKDPKRVVIIDKGFVLQNMIAMNLKEKIVATGGIIDSKLKKEKRDTTVLFPEVYDLPVVGYPMSAVDFEAIVASKPDLVILRNSEYIKNSEITKKAIETIEDQLKIPLVVINGSGYYEKVELQKHYEGITLLGEVFNKSERASEIINLMKEQVNFIQERVSEIKEEDKPKVMYISLLKGKEVGSVWGEDTGDAKFVREYAGIKNAYSERKKTKMSAEQLISLNPDVIVLSTSSVVPTIDILKKEEYKNISSISAIKNNRIASLGLLTWWGDWRLEVPVILSISAKAAYPEKFADFHVNQYVDEYHKKLYALNEEKAKEIKEAQLLGWMEKYGF
ncbi:MAG: ABC transporter substrate-binding protein [Brachymonas sp.]|nr:ABC transporter substrate-binding protein [Brachymonas sp.]